MKTEDRIVAKALEMFNKNGIEYVGLRELAALLDMRVSNITYYFPTKDDLVKRIAMELTKANNEVVKEYSEITMLTFLQMFNKAFHNHVQFRCLFISLVHIMSQNKTLSEGYKKNQMERGAALRANLKLLGKSGYLHLKTQEELNTVVDIMVMMIRFWISEATLLHGNLSTDKHIRHYTGLIAKFLLPYSTAKGKKDIEKFLAGL